MRNRSLSLRDKPTRFSHKYLDKSILGSLANRTKRCYTTRLSTRRVPHVCITQGAFFGALSSRDFTFREASFCSVTLSCLFYSVPEYRFALNLPAADTTLVSRPSHKTRPRRQIVISSKSDAIRSTRKSARVRGGIHPPSSGIQAAFATTTNTPSEPAIT